jgi:hypothetical protein
MLKAIVSYSKKIPVPESDFSSQGYSLSLETEIPETDSKAIQARLHSTFAMVKDTVEQELANGQAKPALDVPENHIDMPKHTTDKASNAQVKFITDLARQQNISISDLNGRVKEQFKVNSVYDLDRKSASRMVEELKSEGRRKAA